MKTLEYIKKHKLNQVKPGTNLDGFIQDLGNEFENRVYMTKEACLSMGVGFTYSKFLQLVKELKGKYTSINNRREGVPLPDPIFSKVYAIYVIPMRRDLFPEEHQKAMDYRNNKLNTKVSTESM